MANSTFIEIPQNVTDPIAMRNFLQRLIEKLDIVFGNRNTTKFVSQSEVDASTATIQSQLFSEVDIITIVQDNSTTNLEQPTIVDASNITSVISVTYQQAEIIDLKDGIDENQLKINAILQLLKDANLMEN